ncbi:hypothetical protein YC2023_041656 [Brassica napus]
MSVEERVFQEEEMRLKSRLGKQHVEQSFSSRLAQNLMEAFYVKKQKNARSVPTLEALHVLDLSLATKPSSPQLS